MTPQELKNSILQLAIQGKLVEQRAEEGTGEQLYREILAEKAKLVTAGKIKKEKPLPEIAEDEKPFDIPESWKWVRVGSYCLDTFSGKSPVYSNTPTLYKVIGQAANQQLKLLLRMSLLMRFVCFLSPFLPSPNNAASSPSSKKSCL